MVYKLRKNTRIHTISGFSFKIPRGTIIQYSYLKRRVAFKGLPFVLLKLGHYYMVQIYGVQHIIDLPRRGKPFYPLSLLG